MWSICRYVDKPREVTVVTDVKCQILCNLLMILLQIHCFHWFTIEMWDLFSSNNVLRMFIHPHFLIKVCQQ